MRKSTIRKALSMLCTIAMVFSVFASFPVQQAEASTTYSSLTIPTVPDKDGQRLGTVGIEIDPRVDNTNRALVEVEDGWDINAVTVTRLYINEDRVTDYVYGEGIVEINGEPVKIGSQDWWDNGDPVDPGDLENSVKIDDDSFTLALVGLDEGYDNEDIDSIEIWLEFTSVDIDDTGDIRAYFTGLVGQLADGNALIGRGRGGELELTVRSADSFVTEGEVEIRISEDLRGTWNEDEDLELRLPRYFEWEEGSVIEPDRVVFGDEDLLDYLDFDIDGRDLTITLDDDFRSSERTAFDFTATIEVEDDERANKGDIIAEVRGDYDAIPDELVVGVFGDFDITITPEAINTVYAGKQEQEIADITIEEDVPGTIIDGRIVTLTLPEWAAWDEDSVRGESFSDEGVELSFRDFRKDNRTLRLDVKQTGGRGDTPAEIDLEDMEILLDTKAEGDVVVEISGTAAVFGEVTVAEAVSPVTMEVPEPTYIDRDSSGQLLGDIYLTEAEAGIFSDDGELVLDLGRHKEWESGYEIEVVEGDIELGSAYRRAERQQLVVPVSTESDEASTIKVSASCIAYMSAIRGETNVDLTADSSAIVDERVRDGDEDGLHGFGAELTAPATAVVAYIEVEAPAPEEVVMWIGETSYTVGNETKEMDVAPFIEQGRTMVPVRFVAEEFGLEADWGPEEGLTEWVTFEDDNVLIEIEIGSPHIIVTEDGEERTVTAPDEVPAQIVNDRTYLPLRALGEILGAEFDWGPKYTLTEWVSFILP